MGKRGRERSRDRASVQGLKGEHMRSLCAVYMFTSTHSVCVCVCVSMRACVVLCAVYMCGSTHMITCGAFMCVYVSMCVCVLTGSDGYQAVPEESQVRKGFRSH